MKFFRIRLWETFWFEVFLSVLCAAIFFFNILPQTPGICAFIMVLCAIVNCIRLFLNLRGYYRYGRVSVGTYLRTNISVILIITAVASVLAGLNVEPVFTWLFFPFKLMYICFGFDKIVSVLLISVVLILVTLIVPVLVKPGKHRHEGKKGLEEKHNEQET